jgi:hypothetical protein
LQKIKTTPQSEGWLTTQGKTNKQQASLNQHKNMYHIPKYILDKRLDKEQHTTQMLDISIVTTSTILGSVIIRGLHFH